MSNSPLSPTQAAEIVAQLRECATEDAPCGALTTYRVGGTASVVVKATTLDELRRVAAVISTALVPVVVIGRGSNLLVADEGFAGVVVMLDGDFDELEFFDDVVVAGGGALLPVVARKTAAAGLRGFEWAVGVPGTIGGGVRMNAGGHGSDMAASVQSARIIDLRSGDESDWSLEKLQLGFRRSAVKSFQIVVSARLQLAHGNSTEAENEIAEIVRWRRQHQPGGANAGSVFRNPLPDSSGRILDEAGVKGLRVGSAQISEKHANFIVVDDGGRANDVADLMIAARKIVFEKLGIDLHAETHFLGFAAEVAEAAGALRVEEL
ncbi:MAG: UDP-N-acetylmuramate dehydrogenase [Actinomycetota bacterium]|jgi:UDP-N-acetylmuramate dehydrogenase